MGQAVHHKLACLIIIIITCTDSTIVVAIVDYDGTGT